MDFPDVDVFYNNWGLVTGIISLLLAVPLWRWFHSRLPGSKLDALEGLLERTKKLFSAAVGDGTLDDDDVINDIQLQIWE